MNRTKLIGQVAVFTALMLVVGCTPKRSLLEPSSYPRRLVKSGIVKTPSPAYRNGTDLIVIKAVDGEPPTFLETKAVVSPGVHTFQIGIEMQREGTGKNDKSYVTRADTSLEFEVEADHEYLIDAEENERGLWVWAVDLTTNFLVAGEKPR